MPITSPASTSIVPNTQASPANVKDISQQLRTNSAQSKDVKLFVSIGDALAQLQRYCDHLYRALQQPLTIPEPLQITDVTGALIAELGAIIDPTSNVGFSGIWTNNFYAGGTGPSSAQLVIANGIVTVISPAGVNPQIDFDADLIEFFNSSGSVTVKLLNDTGATEGGQLQLFNSAGSQSIALSTTAAHPITIPNGWVPGVYYSSGLEVLTASTVSSVQMQIAGANPPAGLYRFSGYINWVNQTSIGSQTRGLLISLQNNCPGNLTVTMSINSSTFNQQSTTVFYLDGAHTPTWQVVDFGTGGSNQYEFWVTMERISP